MKDFLAAAGFADIKIQVKENAAEIISGWMPGSGAEKYVSSAYVTAVKPSGHAGVRDDVRANACCSDAAVLAAVKNSSGNCGPGDCGPGA
mmetsp:Transcript_35083/g.97001  ORF Transcript_35083/g.97001 Transcript_35083/m.97001 type:complete len:90 (+) Transcript_35083:1057-1326(+)